LYFEEDYLEIHDKDIPDDLTQAQVKGIVSLLGLQPGARILDLACGHGRHSIPLAKLGFDVTGYDLSEVFLERARADAATQDANVRWIRGDMRELAFENEFDAVINMFTAFGYFEDPVDDFRTLEGVRRALVPGGQFLLETVHRDGLVSRFRKRDWSRTDKGSFVLRERDLDLPTDVIHEEARVIRADGSQKVYRMTMRVRSFHAYLELMKDAGLSPVNWYGGMDGAPLDLTSWRLVLISRKPAQ
jgi:SAM-dependent methyltransferase